MQNIQYSATGIDSRIKVLAGCTDSQLSLTSFRMQSNARIQLIAIFIIVVAAVLSISPIAYADTPHKISPSLSSTSKLGDHVTFGNFRGNDLQWKIVKKDGSGNATLLLAHVLEKVGDASSPSQNRRYYDGNYNSAYTDGYFHQNWSGSDICSWLNSAGKFSKSGTNEGFVSQAFSTAQQSAILIYGTSERANPYRDEQISKYPRESIETDTININQKIVLPSIKEMVNGGAFGFTSDASRKIFLASDTSTSGDGYDMYFFRSPGFDSRAAGDVHYDGSLCWEFGTIHYGRAVRPVLRVNPKLPNLANIKSTVATLKSLKVSTGTLSPKFSKTKTSYKVSIAAKKTSAKVTVAKTHAKAKVQISTDKKKWTTATTKTVNPKKGKTVKVYIRVTAESGAKKTYTVAVTRKKK